MTRDEVKKLLAVLKTAYPYFYNKQPNAELSATINLWYAALKEFDYEFINGGLKNLIQTSKYPPTVAEVLESAKKQPNITDPLQQPYVPLYLYDSSGNAIRSKDGHFLLNTPENQKLLDSPKLRIAE